MKCVFQLLNTKTGVRSPVMVAEREQFGQMIADKVPLDELDTCAVMVVMEQLDPDAEFEFSTVPFMTAKAYCDYFGVKQNG